MFGRGQPPQSPAQILPPAGPPLESGNAVVPVESLDAPVDRPAVPSPSPAPAASGIEPGQRPMRVAATPQPRPQAMIDPAATADGIAFLSPEPASADEGASPAVATARRANQTRPPRADVSLIMREKDGAVALIAAGPALDPQACALLRRLARAILARSGLDLAQFHLNGVPLAPDSMIMIGGSHGTRTR
jgi:hypothetical protein